MELLNYTPHSLVLRNAEGVDMVVPSSGCARVSNRPGQLNTVKGIPVPVADPDSSGEVTGLPDPEADTYLIVSGFVGAALKGRKDILVPGTGPGDGAVRNDKRHIVAITRLKRV